jgi:stearoyl-CoA desaturase (delta-9 desaturase)
LAFAIPFGIGYVVTGTLGGALAMMFWAGLMRMMFTHHVTWSINSICHMFGTRPFSTRKDSDRSTNFILLALLTLGEAFHNNHHAFPYSAYHGLRWWERMLDPSGWVIWWMKQFGLVWNVKSPNRSLQEERLAMQPS